MGGRGRGGGAGQTARAVADALGIARHEMASFNQAKSIDPVLYPVLNRSIHPLEINDEVAYMVSVKYEVVNRFHESEFYLGNKEKKDIKRYTDKYKELQRDKLNPHFSRIPEELSWQKLSGAPKAKKKKLVNIDDEMIEKRLSKLEEKEEGEKNKEDDDDDSASEKSEEHVEAEALSEDGYAEEDNDYITTYFDNGEGYGDAGSDDNMDGDEY